MQLFDPSDDHSDLDFSQYFDFPIEHENLAIGDSSVSSWGECMDFSNLDSTQWNKTLASNLDDAAVQDFSIEPPSHCSQTQPVSIDSKAKADAVILPSSAKVSTPPVEISLEESALDQPQNKGLLNDNERWNAISIRSRAADRQFVYGVLSTKVYCRPSCPSRRPARKNAKFFPYPGAAEAAERENFRACKRCKPKTLGTANAGVLGVAVALQRIADEVRRKEQNISEQKQRSNLEALAKAAGLSMFHFHRLFKAVTLMTPVGYTNACHLLSFQDALGMDADHRGGETEAKLRHHERSCWNPRTARKALGGIPPSEYSQGAEGANIEYTIVDSALGIICIAWSKKKLMKCRCPVSCKTDVQVHALLIGIDAESRIRKRFPAAVASNAYSRWLLQCVQELRDEGKDRETELPHSCLPSLRRAKVWSRVIQDPVLGENRKDICNSVG